MARKAHAGGSPHGGVEFRDVDPHCLESIVGLSGKQEVLAGEDTFDERGVSCEEVVAECRRRLDESDVLRQIVESLYLYIVRISSRESE